MKVRYKLSLLIIGLMLVGCLYITQSYALWIITEEQTNENEMDVGCFSIGFSEQSESIKLDNTYPVNDSIGLSTNPYTFTITNTCTINNNYVLTLNTLSTNTLDASKIKYALYKSSEEKPNVGSKLSRINTDLENLMVENLGTSYILDTGVLSGGTKVDGVVNNGEEVTYNLYLWIDDIAGNEVEGQTFEASINVINAATESNDIGEVYGSAVAKCGAEGKDAVTCMKENANLDTINLAYDGKEVLGEELGTDDNNLRYIGSNPNNYIDIGDRDSEGNPILWQIIGVMNNVTEVSEDESKSQTVGSHMKIIRKDSIGNFSWDNNSRNDWNFSDLQQILNNGAYWEKIKGECPTNGETIVCDFKDTGLNLDAKAYISNVIYTNSSLGGGGFIPNYFYENEHKNNMNWIGKIGLMYVSDYGFATSGGSNVKRDTCLNRNLRSWSEEISLECVENDWLYEKGITQWTINPRLTDGTMFVNYDGCVSYVTPPISQLSVKPVLYLKSNVKITNGNGTTDNPFTLS